MRRPFFAESFAAVRAVASYVSTHREDLPIRHPVKVLIASPEPFREPDGYTIATSIEEVLVDAGFLPTSD
jgi:hypothetical protein